MVIEDYVSFETAKLLKEKEFDIETCTYWDLTTITKTPKIGMSLTPKNWNYKWKVFSLPISAPTLQMAMKWLREIHHLTIDVFHFKDWKVNIKTIPDDYFKADYSYPELKPAETYEQACEAAIKYCLEKLI